MFNAGQSEEACEGTIKDTATRNPFRSDVMKKTLAVMCVTLACSAGVGMFAQTPAAQMDSKMKMKDGAMTMSGCIATGMDGKGYMLNNAMHVGMPMDKPMAKPMDKPAMPPGHMMSFELAGADVKAHMGHKVELTGTLSKADKDHMDKMMKMDQKDKDKMMADPKMKAMKFTVTAVKMISATCS